MLGMSLGQMGLVSSGSGLFPPTDYSGPTLDLNFVGSPITDPLQASARLDNTLELNFLSQSYAQAYQYMIWE
jgi:hypothetical protein